ncbi:outer membrane lipoprotein chaperone LolA [Cognaticolwellia aestuarii]|jgi:outer membrane lipoprotein carrier protein|uniref:outer membrane lipoprotein chaperone LolA n=1 Tax=Cognaticolwellia aestuarii TaxID=329993 RepID=UPI00079744F9|nr:outer membrane lipoprotein chaperone LolA [Cognaticolwellia aestuarii]KXJ57449.1 MAG: hypothetical protein AXW17_12975 [Colwellia sp. Phe_37]|tara:strand:+ start:8250 stop:8948 length:699 start_codon:yes stop_codon:yes gene_type:complete
MFKKMKLLKSAAVIATLFTSVLTSNTAIADSTEPTSEINANAVTQESDASKAKLMAKLAKIEFFSAEFSQKIFDETGNELQQGSGLLSVSKPNLVNWQTTLPDESLIVSDGSNLWFYDPFVEQVSVYSLANAIANTPILLITSNDEKLWRDYNVSQLADNRYLISANNDNARVKSLELTFAEDVNNVELSAFNILDATGQLSVITLSNHNEKPDTSLFTFTVPEGVYLDDQR